MQRRWKAHEDQVVRQLDFTAAHPGVNICFRQETGIWEATYTAEGNVGRMVRAFELGEVLDRLTETFGDCPA